MTKKSRQKLKYLENEKSDPKSVQVNKYVLV